METHSYRGQKGVSIANENQQRSVLLGTVRSVVANAYRPPNVTMAVGISRSVYFAKGQQRSRGELLLSSLAQETETWMGKETINSGSFAASAP